MDPDAGLQAELKALHRGRGVRRAQVREWLGPRLQEILQVPAHHSEDEVRTALVRLLREHSERFPRDLRYLILVATGIAVDEPFLEDRLAVAEKALDRSGRVLRRRLRVAEQLLADSLTQVRTPGTGPFDDAGWHWERHDLSLVLREDAVLTLSRTLRALADHQKYIHEAFVIPGLPAGAELEFSALTGFAVLDVDHPSPGQWGVTLELPRTLTRGQEWETSLRVRVPSARALNPYMVLAPLRPVRQLRLSVDFGPTPLASRAWLLDGTLPSDLAVAPGVSMQPSRTPVLTGEFANPRVGLAYGVGWEWTD